MRFNISNIAGDFVLTGAINPKASEASSRKMANNILVFADFHTTDIKDAFFKPLFRTSSFQMYSILTSIRYSSIAYCTFQNFTATFSTFELQVRIDH